MSEKFDLNALRKKMELEGRKSDETVKETTGESPIRASSREEFTALPGAEQNQLMIREGYDPALEGEKDLYIAETFGTGAQVNLEALRKQINDEQ